MTKNSAPANQMTVVEDDYEFSDMMDESYDNDEMIAGMMSNMIEASSNQMLLALELTKLATEKDSQSMNADEVIATFTKAASAIEEKFPLNALLEKFMAGK